VRSESDLGAVMVPGFLDGLSQRRLDEVRQMRSQCQELEVALSYVRRLAQGRLDIVSAVLAEEELGPLDSAGAAIDAGSSIHGDIVGHLSEILGAQERPSGPGRMSELLAPAEGDPLTAELLAELDAIVGPELIGGVTSLGEDELTAIASQLREFEAKLSSSRRELHDRIDRLQAEIVSRYKSGEAEVDSLLS